VSEDVTRPTVTYACEARVLKGTIKNKLIVFERKVFKKDYWSYKRGRCKWRMKTNDELIRHKNILNYIKAQRLS
jgi:hypothetical protein